MRRTHSYAGEVGQGDAFVISLKDASCTTNITQVDPGTYDIVVHDYSTFHDFHLTGSVVDIAARIETIETVTWTVDLSPAHTDTKCDAPRSR